MQSGISKHDCYQLAWAINSKNDRLADKTPFLSVLLKIKSWSEP
jgi:hypothetical protein